MSKPHGRPYTETRLVRFLQKRILELRPKKTQTRIASEAGFKQQTMLAMIKSGTSKLPLDRVPGLAQALECDPAHLFKLAIEQLGEDTTDTAIRSIFGVVVTENEAEWIRAIREASNHSDPRLTSKGRASLKGIFGK